MCFLYEAVFFCNYPGGSTFISIIFSLSLLSLCCSLLLLSLSSISRLSMVTHTYFFWYAGSASISVAFPLSSQSARFVQYRAASTELHTNLTSLSALVSLCLLSLSAFLLRLSLSALASSLSALLAIQRA